MENTNKTNTNNNEEYKIEDHFQFFSLDQNGNITSDEKLKNLFYKVLENNFDID